MTRASLCKTIETMYPREDPSAVPDEIIQDIACAPRLFKTPRLR